MALPLILLAQLAGAAAPLIGQIMGGKAATAGKMVGDIAKVVTGVDDADSAVEVLRANPEKALEFEKAVLAAEGELKALMIKDMANQRETELEDVKDARARDIALRKVGDGTNTRANTMILCAAALLAYIVYAISTTPEGALPTEVVGLYNLMAGWILKMLSDAFAFEFGSSKGSKDKTSVINALMEKMQGIKGLRGE
jgi:hypothetical protein